MMFPFFLLLVMLLELSTQVNGSIHRVDPLIYSISCGLIIDVEFHFLHNNLSMKSLSISFSL